MTIDSIRFEGGFFSLSKYSLIKLTGEDRESFLNNQLSNDFKSLSIGKGQVSCRLDRGGRVQFFCFALKGKSFSYLMILKELAISALEDLDKVLIMEEVQLELLSEDLTLIFDPKMSYSFKSFDPDSHFCLNFYGQEAHLIWGTKNCSFIESKGIQQIDEDSLEKLRVLSGFPLWKKEISTKTIVNYSYLNEIAVSYKKGCFLGQETISKIENNRGAGNYPVLFQVENSNSYENIVGKEILSGDKKVGVVLDYVQYEGKSFLCLNLPRAFRVKNKEFNFNAAKSNIKGKVLYFPYFHEGSSIEKSKAFFHKGIEYFQQENIERAKEFLKTSIKLNSDFADAYESLGVILGREGKYSDAIQMMDELLKKDPESVMAHTNKSLYFMKMGKIEEAEAEKEKATVKEFKKIGEEAKKEAILKEEEQKKEVELKRREEMFVQVLELDKDDELANFGLGDISLKRGEFQKAKGYLEKVLLLNSKHSMSYLLLGKTFIGLGESEKAKRVFTDGIKIASSQGDMMPANEMQVHLNKLYV